MLAVSMKMSFVPPPIDDIRRRHADCPDDNEDGFVSVFYQKKTRKIKNRGNK